MKQRADAEKGEWPAGLSISPRADRNQGSTRAWKELLARLSRDLPGDVEKKIRGRRRKMAIDMTWVTDRIAVGGGIWNAENMKEITRTGVTHIIDMQIEFDDTPLAEGHEIEVCWNPIDDDFEPKPAEVFEKGVKFALAAMEDERAKIFVHCAAGVHRAPMMTLALLGVMGWAVEDAMDLIEGRRPVADFADVYVRSVEDFLQARNQGARN